MAVTDTPSSPLQIKDFLANQAAKARLLGPQRVVEPLWIGPVRIDPPVLQAPMAGFTNYAYRQIVRMWGGAGLLATEMVSARAFAWNDQPDSEHPDRLWGVKDEPRPLAVQIWDNDPDRLARVAARLAHQLRVSVVDLNFGCPVKQVTQKAHSGSYLLSDPPRMGRIIERVVRACEPVPVTAKIRLGCRRGCINAVEVARVVEQSGAAAVTVHGRTARDYFQGQANWDEIAKIKPHLRRIPLIGNGDIDSPHKALAAFRQYGVDGIMIGRAALGRPWLFRQVAAALCGEPVPDDPSLDEQRHWLLYHYRLVCERFGAQRGTALMRKYACCYAQGLPGARLFRTNIAQVQSPSEFHEVVDKYFPRPGQSALAISEANLGGWKNVTY